jgi:SET family sugar efflux transporter-like MFS transporter
VSIRSGLQLLKVPFFAPTTLAILFTILTEAVAGSYTALLAVEKLGMGPLELSTFLTLAAVSGIGVTTLFGQMHDRRPALWPLYVSLVAKIGAAASCAFITEAWMLYVAAFVLFGLSSATFPLLFAIAKGYLDQAGGDAPARGMASLRMTSSLGWAIGPAVGAGLVALWSFPGVYIGAAMLGVGALLIVLVSRVAPQERTPAAKPKVTLEVVGAAAPLVVSLTAFNTAMFMGSNATSILVVKQLGTETDVGLLYSLCALLEVFVMGTFVVQPRWSHSRLLLAIGFGLLACYFLMPLLVPSLATFYVGQVLRAAAIGIVSIVGMARLQEMLPGRTGVASALYGNTMSAAVLTSGVGTGLLAEAFGYWSIFAACVALSVLGGVAGFVPLTRSARRVPSSTAAQ